MGSEWEATTVGALLGRDGGSVKTGPFGTVLKSAEYSTDGVPLISVGEVGYGSLEVRPSTPRAPREVVERLPEYLLESGDIVFGRKGAVDRSAHVRAEQAGWFLGSDGIRLRLPSTCDSRFVAYHLQSPPTRSWLIQHATGSTMPSLNQNTIERIPIALPPIQEQRRIAGILGALDDKIDLNRRMSQTLESMARALFKSWFIDFDPVRAKSEGLDTGLPDEIDNLFTDAVELSDWGEIPCGWQPTALGDLCERPQYGFTASATDQAVGPRFLRITDINKRPWIEWASVPYCEASETERRQYRVKPGDVLIARMADPGHGVMIEEDTGAVYASYLIRFRPIDHRYDRFLQYWLRSDDYWSLVDGYRTGTTRASLNAQVLSAFRLVLPPPALADAFGTQVSGLRSLLTRNVSESTILSEARDHLLARLMTGARTDRPKERVEGARL